MGGVRMQRGGLGSFAMDFSNRFSCSGWQTAMGHQALPKKDRGQARVVKARFLSVHFSVDMRVAMSVVVIVRATGIRRRSAVDLLGR